MGKIQSFDVCTNPQNKLKKKIAKNVQKKKLYMMYLVNRGVIQFELAVCKCIIMHIDDRYIYLECSCV